MRQESTQIAALFDELACRVKAASKAPFVWSCPEGPASYVSVYKSGRMPDVERDVDEDDVFDNADVYSVFPADVRDDYHVRYGKINLPSGPIWVVVHSAIEHFFTNNKNWQQEIEELAEKMDV